MFFTFYVQSVNNDRDCSSGIILVDPFRINSFIVKPSLNYSFLQLCLAKYNSGREFLGIFPLLLYKILCILHSSVFLRINNLSRCYGIPK